MSRKIVVFGAGKSTSYLIDYFLEKSTSEKLHLTIADINPAAISNHISSHQNCDVVGLDIFNDDERKSLISKATIVVSMLPARLHIKVAKDCILYKKHLVTASYVSDEIMALNDMVKQHGLVFMNEVGLDPDIDHMSAMEVLDRIRKKGGEIAVMVGSFFLPTFFVL